MASCDYIQQIMFRYVFQLIKQVRLGSIGLDECKGKLMEDLKTQKQTNIILKSTMLCYFTQGNVVRTNPF